MSYGQNTNSQHISTLCLLYKELILNVIGKRIILDMSESCSAPTILMNFISR